MGQKWDPNYIGYSINNLELLAVKFGLLCFAPDIGSKRIKLHIDNTSAISLLCRGYSSAVWLNQVAGSIQKDVAHLGLEITHIQYVKSASNYADAPSRNAPFPLIPTASPL